MKKTALKFLMLPLVGVMLIGCGEEPKPEPVPPTPEEQEYQQYVDEGGTLSYGAWTKLRSETTVHDGGFVYVLNEDKDSYSISYEGDYYVKAISVPSTFLGRKITAIMERGFENLEFVTRFYVPSSVKEIGDFAFYNCDSIGGIYVNGVFHNAFQCGNQSALQGSEIELGHSVFANCDSVTTLNIDAVGNSQAAFSLTNSSVVDKVTYSVSLSDASSFKYVGSLNAGERTINSFSVQGIFRSNSFKFIKGEEEVASFTSEFSVYSDVYNVAFLSATYPTTIFSLKAHEFTNYGEIPTYVFLERNKAFAWDKQVYGIKPVPTVSWKEGTTAKYGRGVEFMNDYVRDLYEANPNSFINFYVTDISCDMVYKFFVCNRIPESQYKVVMLSDGTASANLMVTNYAVDNPQEEHNKMMKSLAGAKAHLWKTGEFDIAWLKKNLYKFNKSGNQFVDIPSFHFNRHLYTTLLSFENCEWWVNRFRATENLIAVNQKDPVFTSTLISHVKNNIYANSLLAALGHDEEEAFKELFHFDDAAFNTSREQGQKIMVVLGTSWAGEKDNLYDYLKLTMTVYGDQFDYYYKPHPGYPTSLYPERSAILDKLRDDGYSIEELDASIAAEIFMYFNKDIYLCGYSSSTYASLDDSNYGMGALDWGKRLPTDDSEYRANMYAYSSVLPSTDPLFATLGLDSNKNYYLVEFNDLDDSARELRPESGDSHMKDIYAKHEIGVYCSEDVSFKYYKFNGVDYTEVDADGNPVA